MQTLFQFFDEGNPIPSIDANQVPDHKQRQGSITGFQVADARLGDPQAGGGFQLGHASGHTQFPQ